MPPAGEIRTGDGTPQAAAAAAVHMLVSTLSDNAPPHGMAKPAALVASDGVVAAAQA